ncbi:tRNA (adenosine(37)-N6)-threonylcarbamoyltransferase complex ATPase subunit type 1 TsaE [Roseobacter sp.]|uniref:tRNA (adenosine(37)-N6)-threonylcarbamoyltransferase complex ATPase subunit type 1 TsaE n=1 Tax=Roseobacter sp. TaxID=1907202 RepID=UPI0032968D66
MTANRISLTLDSSDATAQVAATLGPNLTPGDTVLLTGDVGAGKTHFARHLIQSILVSPEDVPSPTFTLVQTYDTTLGALWHTDLYRITTDTELDELGLPDAFETAICLIEWPDRLDVLTPQDALALTLSQGPSDDSRHLTATWTHEKWARKTQGFTQ